MGAQGWGQGHPPSPQRNEPCGIGPRARCTGAAARLVTVDGAPHEQHDALPLVLVQAVLQRELRDLLGAWSVTAAAVKNRCTPRPLHSPAAARVRGRHEGVWRRACTPVATFAQP